ncbi:sugar ABC transporter substrate-binding protein [Wukongibacter baidiensis]|uniref:ABC transporter substrate-binding protein n=1 Tax=Wukongibacter baidiensis TaxID=1723361 RepID=UPI003D7FD8A6
MKRFISMSLVLLLVLTMVAGCGSQSASQDGKQGEKKQITLGIWDENQKPALQKIVDKFNAQNQEIEVTIELTPWSNYWTKLDAAAGAGEAPDVFWMNVFLPKYVDGEVILPLDELIKRDSVDLSGYVDATVKMYNYNGTQWAMPKGLDSVAVAYNKEIFDKYGVEYPKNGWTWEDMRGTAAKLRDGIKQEGGDEYPILMELDAQPSHFNFVHQTGGEVISSDYTKSGYNMPETTKAYQKVVDLFNDELLAPYVVLSETKGTDLFLSKKGAILFVGSWKTSVLEESSIAQEDKLGLITMPKQEASNASVLGGLGYSIFKGTKNPDAAWEFVKFISGPEGNKIQAEEGIDIPALKSAQQYYLNNFEKADVKVFFEAAENAVGFPAGPALVKWLGVVNDNTAKIFAQEISAEEGTAAIYKEMQKIIDEN